MLVILPPYTSHTSMKCSDSGGAHTLIDKMHPDENTLYGIVELERAVNDSDDESTRGAAKNYLCGVFNEINVDLDRHGVQIEGDYSFSHYDVLVLDIVKENICLEKNVSTLLTRVLAPKLTCSETDGLLLRFVGVFREVSDPIQVPFFTNPNRVCGHIATVFSLDPATVDTQTELLV